MLIIPNHINSGNGSDLLPYVEPVVTPGHEFSGTVVQLGEQADKVIILFLLNFQLYVRGFGTHKQVAFQQLWRAILLSSLRIANFILKTTLCALKNIKISLKNSYNFLGYIFAF